MVPTGGVNLETAGDFIRAGSEALGIGGELVSQAALSFRQLAADHRSREEICSHRARSPAESGVIRFVPQVHAPMLGVNLGIERS